MIGASDCSATGAALRGLQRPPLPARAAATAAAGGGGAAAAVALSHAHVPLRRVATRRPRQGACPAGCCRPEEAPRCSRRRRVWRRRLRRWDDRRWRQPAARAGRARIPDAGWCGQPSGVLLRPAVRQVRRSASKPPASSRHEAALKPLGLCRPLGYSRPEAGRPRASMARAPQAAQA